MANFHTYTLSETIDIIGVLIVVVLIPLAVLLAAKIIVPFLNERALLKTEIRRSDSEEEARYYKKKLRRLYLKHIPFIGFFFK